MNLRIGSRGSQLALWQAHHIEGLLRAAGHAVEIEIIKTTGDRLQEITFAQVGSKGMFTKEIEDALAEGRIDLAVHSLKDLPTELPEQFALAATPVRVDPRDAFVSARYESLAALPNGARVGTSSQRRRAQLRALRGDLEIVEFRGNVDTRLRKLAEGQVDAILLASAGLDRLERAEMIRERLDPSEFCPAAGQGALGIETRRDDDVVIAALAFLDYAETRFAVTVERAALAALGGGCQVPIGIHCRQVPHLAAASDNERVPPAAPAAHHTGVPPVPTEPHHTGVAPVPVSGPGNDKSRDAFEIFGVVAAPDSGASVRIRHGVALAETDPVALGQLAAQMLLDAGAGALLIEAGEAVR